MNDLELRMGWMKDYPDMRDFAPTLEQQPAKLLANEGTETVKTLLKKVGIDHKKAVKAAPSKVDLRQWCSQVENQGALGSCTAHAAMGVLEYYQRRAYGKHVDGSRLFLYKTSRNLLNWKGDTGAYLRTAMAALAMFGAPLEKFWPYDVAKFEEEPGAFVYAMAQNFKAITYYRLDPIGITSEKLLTSIKTHLQSGLPSMFGFTCYSSLYQAKEGKITFPQPNEKVIGGHAVIAIGYDDNMEIDNGVKKSKGAIMIRNSWGPEWGAGGYGYLPYDYILGGIAVDFWVLIKNDWIDTGNFGLA
jgi:C1A family cysteine protease